MEQNHLNETRLLLANVPEQSREYLKGEGTYLIQVFREGAEVGRREGRNLVVNTGKNFMAKRLFSNTPAAMNYMQLGKSNGAAASNQTGVQTPLAKTTLSGRQAVGTKTMVGRTAKFEHTWTAGEISVLGLEEAGLFNQMTTNGGIMLARFVYTLVNKTNSDTLKITWTVRVN